MKKNDILIILVPSLLIVLLWVIFNVYHSFVTSTIPSDLNYSIQSISPDFDSKTIDDIKTREVVDPSFDASDQNFAKPNQSPPVASESASASPGANLSQ